MNLITTLVEESQCIDTPWNSCYFDEDFILVSEFSKLEGPRPVLTIPGDGGGSFNKNTFAVRIMSVDCTALNPVEAGLVPSFQTHGDTQVVLLEPGEGAVAYIHHFTLYDIHARGFVRPFCMAYVTNQCSKIMNNFGIFRDLFTRISSYFKFGNAIVFLKDLFKRHEYLSYTRRKLLDNNKQLSSLYVLPRDMKGFNLETVESYLTDSSEMQNIIHDYIDNEQFAEQRAQYTDQLDCLLNVFEGKDLSVEQLNEQMSHIEPRDVGISSGRKFDTKLRNLDELCSPTKEEAHIALQKSHVLLRKGEFLDATRTGNTTIKSLQEVHKHDDTDGHSIDHYSKDFFLSPKIHCSRNLKVFLPFAESTQFELGSSCSTTSKFMDPDLFNRQLSFSSLSSRQNSFEIIKTCTSSSDDEFGYSHDPGKESLSSTIPSTVSSESAVDIEATLTESRFSDSVPGVAKRIPCETVGSTKYAAFSVVDGSASPKIVRTRTEKTSIDYKRDRDEFNRTKPSLNRGSSIASFDSNKSSYSTTSELKVIKNDYGQDSLSTSPNFFNPPLESNKDACGTSLIELQRFYSFFSHLVYSLMIGRPVVISANRNNKQDVKNIIISLLPCVPGFSKNKNSVVFWTTGPFHILNLATVKLIGLAKSKGKDFVPNSVLPYVTVLDFENSTLMAPSYDGVYLNGIFDRLKDWPSENVFLEKLHSVQIELSTHAFSMFSLLFADVNNAPHSSPIEERRQPPYHPTMKITPQRFFQSMHHQDIKIIEYIAEVLKDEFFLNFYQMVSNDVTDDSYQARSNVQSFRYNSNETLNIKLSNLKCRQFTNAAAKKK